MIGQGWSGSRCASDARQRIRLERRLCSAADMQLLVNAFQMNPNGLDRNSQFFGNFLVDQPANDTAEDFLFAFGKMIEVGTAVRRDGSALKGLDDLAGYIA